MPSSSDELRERGRLAEEGNALERALFDEGLAPPAAGALRVRLAFGAEADLDLFVTDPTQETVYFANTPTKQGGELHVDRRCDSPAPRVERVTFEHAPKGRYRVGVDFPKRCDRARGAVASVVWVEWADGREVRRKTLVPGVFDPVVLEFDLP